MKCHNVYKQPSVEVRTDEEDGTTLVVFLFFAGFFIGLFAGAAIGLALGTAIR